MMANLWLRKASTCLALLIHTGALRNLLIVRGETCNSDLKIRPVVDISSSPEKNSLPTGASITLTCTAEPRGIDSGYLDRWVEYIEWYGPQGRRLGARCHQPSNIHAHKLKLSCPLVLKNLTVDKFGRYTCQAGNGYLKHCTRKSFETRIQYDQTPQIVQDPKSQSASIGSNATFSCTARGFPRPTIHWIKDNASNPLQSNPRASVIQDRPRNRSQLFISRVEMGDYGKYQCIANNSIGRSQSGVAILSKDVQKLEVVDGPKNQSVSIGFNATFSCTVKGVPRPTIHWIKDNASYPLESNPRASVIQDSNEIRSLLLLTGVQKEDFGKYQCIANNSFGRSQSGVAFLNKDVQKPEIVQGPKNQSAWIGSNATFSCTAKGFPRPTIQWIKDNVSYPLQSNPRASVTLDGPTNRGQLFITRVEMEDYGNYQCLAKNSVGGSHSGKAVLSKATTTPTPVTERQLEDSASHTTIIAVSCVLIAALICVVIGFLWNRCRNRDNIHAQYTQTVAIRLRSLTNRQTESRILREHTGF